MDETPALLGGGAARKGLNAVSRQAAGSNVGG